MNSHMNSHMNTGMSVVRLGVSVYEEMDICGMKAGDLIQHFTSRMTQSLTNWDPKTMYCSVVGIGAVNAYHVFGHNENVFIWRDPILASYWRYSDYGQTKRNRR